MSVQSLRTASSNPPAVPTAWYGTSWNRQSGAASRNGSISSDGDESPLRSSSFRASSSSSSFWWFLPAFISTLLPGRSSASPSPGPPPGMMWRGWSGSVRLRPSRAATAQKLGTPGTITQGKPSAFSSSII